MYVPPPFKPEESLAFADARGLGLVRGADNQDPLASWVPLDLSCAAYGQPQAAYHVARHNEPARRVLGPSRRLLAIAGGDAYVLAGGYVSPVRLPRSPDQAVQLSGRVGKLGAKTVSQPTRLELTARPDTGSQHIADLMRRLRQQAIDEANRRKRSMQ